MTSDAVKAKESKRNTENFCDKYRSVTGFQMLWCHSLLSRKGLSSGGNSQCYSYSFMDTGHGLGPRESCGVWREKSQPTEQWENSLKTSFSIFACFLTTKACFWKPWSVCEILVTYSHLYHKIQLIVFINKPYTSSKTIITDTTYRLFKKQTFLLSCRDLGDKIDNSSVFVCWVHD